MQDSEILSTRPSDKDWIDETVEETELLEEINKLDVLDELIELDVFEYAAEELLNLTKKYALATITPIINMVTTTMTQNG